jgi:hypothetical protein
LPDAAQDPIRPCGRITDRALLPPPLEAHVGVDVVWSNDRPLITPRSSGNKPRSARPFPMPMLPGRTLERMCGVLRCLWRSRSVCASWALYVHTRTRFWVPLLPPQVCAADGTQVRLTYPPDAGPGAKLRLAGTCSTAVSNTSDPQLLMADLPPVDGLHVVWHRDRWLDATAFITAAGTTIPLPLDRVVTDDLDPVDIATSARLCVVKRS